MLALILLAGVWAGAQNALAGGGSFVTLPALILAGVDPKLANITSTIALFPGQVATAISGRALVSGTPALALPWLLALSLAGGVAGAALLLATPSATFGAMLPWLVLAATGLFAVATFGPKRGTAPMRWPRGAAMAAQFATGIYGGYFGGGNGFLVLTVLTLGGLAIRAAGSTKNVLVSAANGSAVLVFALTSHVDWPKAATLGAGSIVGGLAGAWALKRVSERALRIGVVVLGAVLAAGLFVRG